MYNKHSTTQNPNPGRTQNLTVTVCKPEMLVTGNLVPTLSFWQTLLRTHIHAVGHHGQQHWGVYEEAPCRWRGCCCGLVPLLHEGMLFFCPSVNMQYDQHSYKLSMENSAACKFLNLMFFTRGACICAKIKRAVGDSCWDEPAPTENLNIQHTSGCEPLQAAPYRLGFLFVCLPSCVYTPLHPHVRDSENASHSLWCNSCRQLMYVRACARMVGWNTCIQPQQKRHDRIPYQGMNMRVLSCFASCPRYGWQHIT